MLETGTLTIDRHEGIVVIRLSRPEKRNALDLATIAAIGSFFADPPPEVRVAGQERRPAPVLALCVGVLQRRVPAEARYRPPPPKPRR